MAAHFWSLEVGPFLAIVGIGALVAVLASLLVLKFKRREWVLWSLLVAGALLAVGVKALDLLVWQSGTLWRQLALIAALAAILAIALGPGQLSSAYLRLCGLLPARAPGEGMWAEGRRLRVVLGAVGVAGPAFGLIWPKASIWYWSLVAVGIGGASFAWLSALEMSRRSQFRRDPANVAAPARDVLWSTALPWLVLTSVCIASIILGKPVALPGRLLEKFWELLIVTAIGEELIFRGLLLGIALAATRAGRFPGKRDRTSLGYWTVSLAFGLWHVADAVLDGRESCWTVGATILAAGGTVLLTALASRVVLIPLRLRTGTLAAPVLMHFAANAPGIALGAGEFSTSVCLKAVR